MIYALVAFSVLVPIVGQLLFKAVAMRTAAGGATLDLATIAMFAGAVMLYGLSTISWVVALRTLPLSAAYPFFALGFVTTPIAAHFLFGERIGWGVIIGTALVVLGLLAIMIDHR
jgi:drug/metabolite transporter (DMT)-like permease